MKFVLGPLCLLFSLTNFAQEEPENYEQQIENETAANEVTEVEVEEEKPELKWYKEHRVNINSVSTEFLVNNFGVPFYAAIQFLQYKKLLGDIIDVHELQAVPGWDRELIARLMPYVKVGGDENILPLLKTFYKKGESYFQLRMGRVIETQKGYVKNDKGESPYSGSPLKMILRYRFNSGKKLQWGYTAEKDAGETVFKKQKLISDFHSFYFSIQDWGKLESFVAGDFEINMGQGLIHWQSAAYKKSASAVNTLRQGYFAVPHKGLNEQFFHRGIAAAFKVKKFDAGFFAAYNHWDANVETDSSSTYGQRISSIQVSGLHRTANEVTDKNALRVLTFGSMVRYQAKSLQIGLNVLKHFFNIPLQKKDEPANRFSVEGNQWINYSIDYRYTFKNYFFFGEIARSTKSQPALISGLMAVVHPKVDISLVLRKIPPSFRAINGNAFTEQSEPGNENGLYLGFAIKFSSRVILNGYTDVFSMPMIKARTQAPVKGNGQLIQLNYMPDKKNSILVRLAVESRQVTENNMSSVIHPLVVQKKTQFRIHQQLAIFPGLVLNNRLDLIWISAENRSADRGFQVFCDLFWKPPFPAFGFGLRMSRFQTDSYDSRIYSFERDVRNFQSVNLAAGKGWRNYFLIHYKYKSSVHFSLKYMRTYYIDNQLIGTGNEEINRSTRSEYRLQIFLFF